LTKQRNIKEAEEKIEKYRFFRKGKAGNDKLLIKSLKNHQLKTVF